jgi:hypothetical protein
LAKTNITVATFNGGEADKPTLARVDIDIYSRLAEQMENIFPYTQGMMAKAPGSKFIRNVTALAYVLEEDGDTVLDEAGEPVLTEGDSLAVVRPFVRSDEFAYVLEFAANQVHFVLDGAHVTIDGAAATIGEWTDESASPPAGGGAPIAPGTEDVGDPFYVDIDYDWIITTEGGGGVLP